jgi:hypothetical protein
VWQGEALDYISDSRYPLFPRPGGYLAKLNP